ncbi:MAG: right-handed parallel beta-helix repeat-containing protein [bacterium]|nr:right-handed parallel beta-helix repeat-containing protein [bacterium]
MNRVFLLTALLFAFFSFFSASGVTWHVDGSVPASGDGTSWENALKTIQEGIDASSNGDTVLVAEGTYIENIKFNGKNITLTSTDPLDSTVVANTIIDGNQSGSVVTFSGTENETCTLSGFTITNGGPGVLGGTQGRPCHATIENNVITCNNVIGLAGRENGGGLCYCDGMIENNIIRGNWAGICGAGLYDCDGTIMNNRIIGNESSEDGGGLGECDGTIQNNLIAGNTAGESGAGLSFCGGTILNNTIADNSGEGISACYGSIVNCVVWGNTIRVPRWQIPYSPLPSFSCIQDWERGGEGNISEDPRFVDSKSGDYRLKEGSPCINAGANFYWFAWPQRDLDGNCRLWGDRVDIGCYEFSSCADSDGDLLSDGTERSLAPAPTDPNNDDSDGDGLRDGLELLRGSDPMSLTPPRSAHVPSGTPTIQEALCLAVKGEVINVEPGVYQENVRFCPTDVVLRNSGYADPNWERSLGEVVIDGGGAGPAVSFEGSETPACVLAGFTIRNGRAGLGGGIRGGTRGRHTRATICDNVVTFNSAGRGGGIALCDGTIRGCNISLNSAEQGGGGLAFCHGLIEDNTISASSTSADSFHARGGGVLDCDGTIQNNSIVDNTVPGPLGVGGGLADCDGMIRNNEISGNSAHYGGGLSGCHGRIDSNTITGNAAHGVGGGLHDCDALIQNNTIADNVAPGPWAAGGGLEGCHGTIQNNAITGNFAAEDGGGLYFCNGTVHNNSIVRNSAQSAGGGVACCEGTIQNNTITCNSAGEYGGGLYWCPGTIQNNTITGNRAELGGGLDYCEGTIQNNTITGNSAESSGGGLDDCYGAIGNCIIWRNAAPQGAQLYGSSVPAYSCILDWAGGGEGNIADDPLFADPDGPDDDPDTYEDNDYRLLSDSPCIDGGKNEQWMWEAVDLDGNPRIWKGTVDMGAYEYGSFPFKITEVVQAGGSRLTWTSRAGDIYTVWSCDDLLGGSWTEQETVPSGGETTVWSDPDTSSSRKFYRIEVR